MLPKSMGFSGYKKSGKTNIITETAKILKDRGYKVGALKNLHDYAIDTKNSDTWRLRQEVDFVGSIGQEGSILFDKPQSIEELIDIMPQVDFLLIEGFKDNNTFPKILLPRDDSEIEELRSGLEVALYTEYETEDVDLDVVHDPTEIADLVEKKGFKLPNYDCGDCGMSCESLAKEIAIGNKSLNDCVMINNSVQVKVNGKNLFLKGWVQNIIKNTILGLLSSLKEFEKGEIEVNIDTDENDLHE